MLLYNKTNSMCVVGVWDISNTTTSAVEGKTNGATSTNGTSGASKTHVKSASISSASGATPLSTEGQPHNASARDLAQPRPRYNGLGCDAPKY